MVQSKDIARNKNKNDPITRSTNIHLAKFRVPKNSGQHRSSFCFARRDATRFSFIVKKKDLPNAER